MATTTTTATRGHTREDWVDRKQAAILAGCHVDTIRRAEDSHQLTKRTGPNGSVLLNVGELTGVGVVPLSVLDPEISAREVAAAVAVRTELEDLRRAHAELVGRYGEHETLVADLRAHLATQAAFIALLSARTDVAR